MSKEHLSQKDINCLENALVTLITDRHLQLTYQGVETITLSL